jgi:hypothetical protein
MFSIPNVFLTIWPILLYIEALDFVALLRHFLSKIFAYIFDLFYLLPFHAILNSSPIGSPDWGKLIEGTNCGRAFCEFSKKIERPEHS